MNRHGLHSLVLRLAVPISAAGMVGLACTIAGDLPALRKPGWCYLSCLRP
jgi:hypothetical protein